MDLWRRGSGDLSPRARLEEVGQVSAAKGISASIVSGHQD